MNDELAIFGGKPVRDKPYSDHTTKIGKEEEEAVIEVLRSQHLSGFSARPGDRFLGGKSIQSFESSLCDVFESSYAVTFNSATSGLHAAIYSSGIGVGDEVITSPFTMSATASSILMCNATPVFCDIEEETYGINPDIVESLITSNTKAILTVNIFGHGSSLSKLRAIADKYNLMLIEDSAQSPLVEYENKLCGHYGDISVFSLNYHKAIQTGEGGFAISEDENLADRMRYLRNHGEVVIGPSGRLDMGDIIGYNYRMTEIEAAIGNIQLKKLGMLNDIRQSLAKELIERLEEIDFLCPPTIKENCSHGFYLFPIKFKKEKLGISRERFVQAMQAEGISIAQGYVLPVHLQPIYQIHMQQIDQAYQGYGLEDLDKSTKFRINLPENTNYKFGSCPIAENLHFEEIITTDVCKYPNSAKEIDEFFSAVKKIQSNANKLKNQ